MEKNFKTLVKGYCLFREKYTQGNESVMQSLAQHGQKPHSIVVACCDSRVDPALILQCNPGDLFVVRNVANIIPSYEKDQGHHGVSAALEFGISFLNIKHLIILGHSQCGGIEALLSGFDFPHNDFITDWMSLIRAENTANQTADDYAKWALKQSLNNSLTFPWIRDKVLNKQLMIHLWYFDIKTGHIFMYSQEKDIYQPLDYSQL